MKIGSNQTFICTYNLNQININIETIHLYIFISYQSSTNIYFNFKYISCSN